MPRATPREIPLDILLHRSWLEVHHKAKDEILPLIHVPEVTAELKKAMTSDAAETVFLPNGNFL